MTTQAAATAADIGLLSVCAFLGTIGASLTGFGQAIIFLFVWQIVELAGYNGDFRSAVFIQALSLFSMQPLILYKAKVWKNAHRRVLLLFVPITLISTPLGQLVSDGVPTNIVQAVAGVLVTFVACWELYSKRKWLLSFIPSSCSKNKKADANLNGEDTAERGEGKAEEVEGESNEKSDEIMAGKANDDATNNDESKDEESSKKENQEEQATISSVYASLALAAEPNHNTGDSITDSSPQTNNKGAIKEEEGKEQLKIGFNKATFITLLAGGKFIHLHTQILPSSVRSILKAAASSLPSIFY